MELYYQRCLQDAHKRPHPNKETQTERVRQLTYWFQEELTKKASQEAIEKVSNYDSSPSEDTGSSPADDSRSSIGVWHVLKKKITGWGE